MSGVMSDKWRVTRWATIGLLLLVSQIIKGSFAAKQPAPQPYGWLDATHCSPFYGWAMDRAQPGMVKWSLYADGKYSKSGPCNLPRPDVEAAGYGKNRGFDIIIPQKYYDGKPHTFAVRVTGSEWELVNSPRVLTCSNMGPAPSVTPLPSATPTPPIATPTPTAIPSATPTPPPVPTPTPSPIEMKTIALRWIDSVSPNAVGYRLQEGRAPRQYSKTVEVGKVTTAPVTIPLDGQPYFFALTAYNAAGEESEFSNEAKYP